MDPDPNQRRHTILVVEDEPTMVAALRYSLEREGFRCLVAGDGAQAIEVAIAERPDLLLLDVMLPGMDGIEVCRRVRARSSVPIIMLTARADELDRVVGLEVGADDYMIKPVSIRELLARVRAGIRRATRTADPPVERIPLGPALLIDPAARRLLCDGRDVALKPREFDLLLFLARNPRHVFTREQLLDRVWGYDFAAQTRTVDVHVRWLREKIEPDPANPIYLLTNRGFGYRLEPDGAPRHGIQPAETPDSTRDQPPDRSPARA
jgi:DNA-binding response OmpR family regulator